MSLILSIQLSTILISLLLFIIIKQLSKMATLTELQDALTALQTSVDAHQQKVIDEIKALKDQIAAGGSVTEADLDGLLTKVKSIQTDVDTTDESA